MEVYSVKTVNGEVAEISREQAEKLYEVIELKKLTEEVRRAITDMIHSKEIPLENVSDTIINDICAEFKEVMSADSARQFALDDTIYEYIRNLYVEDIQEVLNDLETDIPITDGDMIDLCDRYMKALAEYDKEHENDEQRIFVANAVADEYLFEKGLKIHG